MILAGDIGGTKTVLAFFQAKEEQLEPLVEETFPSRKYVNLYEMIDGFTSAHTLKVTQACFGVAGSVRRGRCETTNLPLIVEAQALAKQLEGCGQN
jgi:glucokinase